MPHACLPQRCLVSQPARRDVLGGGRTVSALDAFIEAESGSSLSVQRLPQAHVWWRRVHPL